MKASEGKITGAGIVRDKDGNIKQHFTLSTEKENKTKTAPEDKANVSNAHRGS